MGSTCMIETFTCLGSSVEADGRWLTIYFLNARYFWGFFKVNNNILHCSYTEAHFEFGFRLPSKCYE